MQPPIWTPLPSKKGEFHGCTVSESSYSEHRASAEGTMEGMVRQYVCLSLIKAGLLPSIFCFSLHTPHRTSSAHSFICSRTPHDTTSALSLTYPHTPHKTPSKNLSVSCCSPHKKISTFFHLLILSSKSHLRHKAHPLIIKVPHTILFDQFLSLKIGNSSILFKRYLCQHAEKARICAVRGRSNHLH